MEAEQNINITSRVQKWVAPYISLTFDNQVCYNVIRLLFPTLTRGDLGHDYEDCVSLGRYRVRVSGRRIFRVVHQSSDRVVRPPW